MADNTPQPTPTTTSPQQQNLTESVKQFFSDKDWRFYAAISAGAVVVGAGAYYIVSSSRSSPKKSTPKKKKKGSKLEDKDEPLLQPNPNYKSKDAKLDEFSAINLEKMTAEEIILLSEKARKQYADTLKSRGNKYFSSKVYDKAIQLYTQAIAFRKEAVFYANRAACYAQEDRHQLVIDDCDEALKMDPLYVKALNRRASAYEQLDDLNEALYNFTAACIIDEFKNETASTSMERVLKKIAETKAKAILETKQPRLPSPTYVSSFLDSFRADSSPIGPTTGDTGTASYNRGRECLKTKNYPAAYEYFKKAVEQVCDDDATQALAFDMRGTFTFLMGDADGALADYNKSIELNKNHIQAWVKRASIYMEKNDPEETFRQFEEAVSVDPSNPDIYYHRGQVHFITGDFQKAISEYKRSIELDPNFLYAHIQLGVGQYKTNMISEGMSTFQNALKQFKTSADLNNYYGELLFDQLKFDEALQRFEKAIELDSTNPLPYINKALLIYQYRGDPKTAEELCRAALKADPNCDVAIATLAQFMLQQQRATEALEFFEKSVELARTEAELANAISYREAAMCQIRFAKEYPQVKAGRM